MYRQSAGRVGTIPSADAYTTLNLAQSVLIFLYEIRFASLSSTGIGAPPTTGARKDVGAPDSEIDEDSPPPTHGEIEACISRLFAALAQIGFFEGTAEHHMKRNLRSMFGTIISSRRELNIIEGIAHRIRLDRKRSTR